MIHYWWHYSESAYKLKELWCWLFGHNIAQASLHPSTMANTYCYRCGKWYNRVENKWMGSKELYDSQHKFIAKKFGI